MIPFIENYKEFYGVERICRTLNISASTYYAARSRPLSARGRRDTELLVAIRRVYDESGQTFGARRVWTVLREQGVEVARCTVERLMRRAGMSGASGAPGLRRAPVGWGTVRPELGPSQRTEAIP
ncbi:IS3 family transposase [Streptomyces sp. NPDC050617]|uniref:IS3 family transposase n=1 Tax=Streptomyces sp. NPDC050617 TaxID=3154628 RepID=UPI00341C2092